MDKEAFLTKLADVLEVNKEELNEEFILKSGDNWDSMAVLATIAMIDEQFGVTVPTKELTGCTSVGALLELIGRNLS